jgi:hypothetical protein
MRRRRNDTPEIPHVVINTGTRDISIRLSQAVDGAMNQDDCMLQLNQLMFQINDINQETIQRVEMEFDRRVVQLYQIMMQLNQLGAESGLTMQQLWGAIENVQS